MATLRMLVLAVAAVLFAAVGSSQTSVAAAAATSSVVVQTTPALPLVDVVFLATTSAGTDKTLYVSSTSDCSARLTPICTLGRSQAGVNYNATTCLFNITGTAISVTASTTAETTSLYWCSSAAGSTSFATLQLHKVLTTPSYAYLNTASTLQLNAATPVGAVVGLYTTSACTALLSGTTTSTVQSSRELSVNVGTRGITYLCAAIPTVLGDSSVLAARSIIYGTNSYDIYTTQGIRHRTVTISADATFLYISLSQDPQCVTLAQEYQQTSSGNAVLTINVPRGTYYFCAILTAGVGSIGAFVPALSTFVVTEYGVQPQTIYANQATSMHFSMDAVDVAQTLQAALFSSSACSASSGTQLTPWSSPMDWTVPTTGTYYACVRSGTSSTEMGFVNQVVVSILPSVALSRTPGIMGLGEVATVTRSADDTADPAVLTVGIASTSRCDGLLASGNTTESGTSASFYVSENSPSTVYLCVSNRLTTDQSNGESSEATTAVFYSLGMLTLSTYSLTYPALRTQTALAIALDSGVQFSSDAYMFLAPALSSTEDSSSADTDDATCDAAIAASTSTMSFPLSSAAGTLTPVTFPTAGQWLLCVREANVLDNAAVRLRTLTVYGNATTFPGGVLPGIPATLAITDVPSSTTVMLTDSTTCSAAARVLATATSSLTGTATLSITYDAVGLLKLCVGYRGESNSQDTAAVLMIAGEVVSSAARVVPAVAVASVETTLSFAAPGAPTLKGYTALLLDSATTAACPASAPSSALQLSISAAASAAVVAAESVATATFTPSVASVGTTYLVCVGTSNMYQSTGTVTIAAAPTLTTNPATLTCGLPGTVTLPSTYTAVLAGDVFVMLESTASCTHDLRAYTQYASGAIDAATGTTASFIVPSLDTGVTTARFCVAKKSDLVSTSLGYADAGTATLAHFTSLSRYAQAQRTNTLVGYPTLNGGSLYLVSCAAAACSAALADTLCASTTLTHYTTSSSVVLTAPTGTYVLCQSVASTSSVVGSDTTVQVIEAYDMTTTANKAALRAYVPFSVAVTGGPSETSGSYTIIAQPLSVDCGTTSTTSQTFTITDGAGSITITDVAPLQSIHFCVRLSDTDAFEIMRGYLLPYVLPAAVVDGAATTLTSGAPLSGASAKLSSSASCTDAVAGGAATLLEAGQATFTVDGCAATTSNLDAVYYCETRESGAYVSRGTVSVLRARNCSGGRPASIVPKYAAPGAAISDYGLAAGALANPRLSTSADCASLVDSRVATVGYAPALGESAVFYVCAEVVGGAALPLFTTAAPTLTVLNWAVSPSAALSRYNATMGVLPSTSMSVNYATPSSSTFFSTSRSCDTSLLTASALATAGGAAVYRTVGVSGLVYVCATDPLTSAATAVAAFLSVTPPSVVRAAPAIVRGASYTATLVVDGATPLYAMQPGADASYPYHAYYTSSNRSVFLSADGCATGIAGVATATADTSGRVSFGTSAISAGLGSVALCAETPARTAVVMAKVAVATGKVYPSQFTTGVWSAAIYIPAYANTVFSLSQSSGSCTATTGMPTFTTDGEGYGAVNLVSPQNGAALPTGTYTLCASVSSADLDVIDTIVVVDASFFGVRGTTFVVGVASTMELTDDLVSSYLYAGFSESRECTTMTSTYGTWATLTDASIEVSPTAVRTSGLYLCAQSPRNSSIVALPLAAAQTSTLMFAKSTIALPSGGWDACATYSMDQCYPPGSSAASSSSWLAMVHGECCSSARAVVGKSRMASGTCQLTMDYDAVASYGSSATFNLCVLDDADDAVCTTVASAVPVSTACTRPTKSGGLSRGVIAAIVVCSVVGGLAVIAGIIVLICCCCCRRGDAPKKGKEGELIVYHEYAEDDQHLVGYLVGGQHPLLYYPSGSQQGRSVSPSPPYPSTSSGGRSLVEEMEEEDRDQIALEEARGRYNVRLHFAEEVQRLEAEAKNAAVDAGLDATWASADSCLRGVARPERRCVESIVTEDDVASAFAADEPSVDVSLEDHETKTGRPRAVQAVPEEQDLNVTANADASRSAEAKSGRRKKLRSRSIESNPVPPLSPAESYLTNDDFEEQEESITESNSGVDGSVVAVAAAEAQTSPRRMGDVEEEAPRRRVVVRHFAHPSSVRTRQRHSSPRRETSRERPHLDPTQLTPSTAPGADTRALPVHHRAADVAGDEMNDSAVLARSPIASPEAQDLSEGALAVARMGNDVDAAAGDDDAPTRRACDSGSAEDDETDLLSFTTTQHFHDELRFVREQEDGRRQRLCNWEEEERAALAQAELNAYLALPTPADVHEDDDVASNSSATETAAATTAASHSSAATVARPSQRGDQQTEEASEARRDVPNDEETYHAPFVPATLPSLPPAPRPQTLLNDQNHVVDV